MSDLYEAQQKVVASLQNRIVNAGNIRTGDLKDLALALGCAVDKLAQLDSDTRGGA